MPSLLPLLQPGKRDAAIVMGQDLPVVRALQGEGLGARWLMPTPWPQPVPVMVIPSPLYVEPPDCLTSDVPEDVIT